MPYKDKAAQQAHSRKYYLEHKEKIISQVHANYKKKRDDILGERRQRYRENPEKFLARTAEQKRLHPEKFAAWHKKANKTYRDKLKDEVQAAYGNCCQCCGETERDLLSMDHVRNDGKKHRMEVGGHRLYLWLKQHGFPKENFQLLCFSCNWGKWRFGICPHVNLGREKWKSKNTGQCESPPKRYSTLKPGNA